MTWYEFLIPSVTMALLVRWFAVLVTPYWAWIELFPPNGADESPGVRRQRRRAMVLRLGTPAAVAFVCSGLWPQRFDAASMALVGLGAAGLLLWPMMFTGLPLGVLKSDWALLPLYGGLMASLAVSAWTGAHLGAWAHAREGGLPAFVLENAISLLIGTFVTVLLGGLSETAASRESGKRNERLDEADG